MPLPTDVNLSDTTSSKTFDPSRHTAYLSSSNLGT
jgi:hypothetical protein